MGGGLRYRKVGPEVPRYTGTGGWEWWDRITVGLSRGRHTGEESGLSRTEDDTVGCRRLG